MCKGCYYNDGEVHAECVVCDKMTREEAISILSRPITMKNVPSDILKAHEVAIKALEQESVLDKIRAEIEKQKECRCFDEDDMFVYRAGLDDALEIIDKYKVESEVKT